jgi:DNA-binding XRE family transcriptional regulator
MGKNLSDEMRELLDRWLRTRPGRSLQTLANQTDIPYNTIRRIHIGQADPSLQTCLRLWQVIATPEEAGEMAERHFPDLGRFYSRLTIKDTPRTFATELNDEWKDFNSCFVLAFALMKIGTTETIRKFLGDAGLIAADALCKKGFIRWNDDILEMADGAEMCVIQNSDGLLTILTHLITMFRARKETPFVNIVNVSKEDAETLKVMTQRFVSEAAAIIDKSKGEEIVTLSVLFGNLTKGFL